MWHKTLFFNMLRTSGNCYKTQIKDRNERLPLLCQSVFLSLLLVMVTVGLVYSTLLVLQPLSSQPWSKGTPLHPQSLTSHNQGETIAPYEVAYPQTYHFVLDQSLRHEAPFLVLMVPVAPGNLLSRQVIRQTWGKEGVVLGRAVRVLFLLGMPGGAGVERQQEHLKVESLEYRDLLQSDFLDSYFNLTIKTMVMLEWLSSRCPNASYAMKVDSDMFVNVPNLVSMLAAPDTPTRNYITGIVRLNSYVVRDPTSKWYIPRTIYPISKFPPYLIGNGYIFSLDLAGKLVEASKQVRAIYIEDAYLGMCLHYLGIALSDPPSPALFKLYPPYRNRRCFYSSVVMTLMDSVNDLQAVWRDLQIFGSTC